MNKKRSTRQSAFLNIRILIGLALCLFGIVLSLFAAGVVPSLSGGSGQGQPAQASKALTKSLTIPAKGITLRYPEGWSVARPTTNTWAIVNVPANRQETVTPTVRILIGYFERINHADALSQLAENANESSKPSTFVAIGGWPALQRIELVKSSQSSHSALPKSQITQITTAVAAGNVLVRLGADLPPDAKQQLKDLVLAIGQSLVFPSVGNPAQVQQELSKLQSLPKRPEPPQAGVVSPKAATALSSSGESAGAGPPIFPPVPLNNFGTNGELEIAVSNNGTNIVIVKQDQWVTSNDGGQTFPISNFLPGPGDGDSSIAFGQSGNFYHARLFGGSCPANTSCVEVAASTTNGQTFGALISPPGCPTTGATTCSVDQEHIAADRVNAAAGGVDNVYVVHRTCNVAGNGCGSQTNPANIVCSNNSGAANSWSPRFALENGSDFPRVAVGGDGMVYVVYVTGNNTIRIDKFNPCPASAPNTAPGPITRAAGGTAGAFPRTVSGFTGIPDCETGNPPGNPGFPGLDRCNDGNILSSPTVAVDDTNANHVYVAWATNTANNNNNTVLNNENILVADSTGTPTNPAGVNWGAPVTINGPPPPATNPTARRFMPWVCATGGNAFVTWYDRRAATAANNDLTDYFAASAGLSAGNLVRNNDEFRISTASDPQCNLWPAPLGPLPAAPRSRFDSENCSVQPQLAGVCCVDDGTPNHNCITNPAPSGQRCDFSGPYPPPTCTNPLETCHTGGGTPPKYGDYNGNACVLGRLYTVFASGAGLASIRDFFQSYVVASTPTTLTYTGATTGDYHDVVTLSAVLTLSGTSAGVAGQTITFTIGAQPCTGITNAAGAASCNLTLNQTPGPYTVTASFAGSGLFQASSTSALFTITKEETTLSYTGDTLIANNTTAHLSGVLLEDGVVPIAGRTVTFTLGTGGTAQSCSGVTDAAGVASCTVSPVNQPFGAGIVTANFAGDAFYLPSSASAETIIFAFLDHGAFVLGDQTATGSVEFWGHDWSRRNVLSGGRAPDSFKGFAATVSTNPPACGDSWISRPGNSSRPPDTVPPFMGVVVSSSITMSGHTISGNVPQIVVVQTNPGYQPDPGHAGTGTVVAVYCP
jgi:hypothetical protein